MKVIASRLEKEQLRDKIIVVLHGVNEKLPQLKAMGWVEDQPHTDSDEAIILHEPLYFTDKEVKSNGEPVGIATVVPNLGVPNSTEFFDYSKVDVYEGTSPFGSFYSDTITSARMYKPRFSMTTVAMPSSGPQQLNLPSQR